MDSQTNNLPALHERYCAIFTHLGGDLPGRLAAQSYLNTSTAIYHGEVVGYGFLPKLYDMQALRFFDALAQTTYAILEKVTQRYLADPAYRKLFGFSPMLERLICLPTGLSSTIPIMRADIFLNEETMDFQFCEFNTDGTSAMNEDREGCNALGRSETCREATQELHLAPQELFEGWVDAFLELYRETEGAQDDPTIAIVDYVESGTLYEFEEFRKRFEARGLRCIICAIPALVYRDGALYGSELRGGAAAPNGDADGGVSDEISPDADASAPDEGTPDEGTSDGTVKIDLVYRRAVTGEIVAELEAQTAQGAFLGAGSQPGLHATAATATAEVPLNSPLAEDVEDRAGVGGTENVLTGARALVRAVEEQCTCMIGGFVSHIAHSKMLFAVLHLAETSAFLTEEERAFVRRHIPYTTQLDEHHIDLDVLKADKDSWIIKPEDGYGSKGVVAGRDQSAEDWAKALDRAADTVYLVQSFAPQYPMPNTRIIPVDESYKLLYSSPETAAAYLNMHPEQGANALSSLEEWNSLTGLYLYNGRFAGTFIRAGQSGIIAGFAGGITLPTLLADYDPHAGLAIRTREFS